MAKQSEKPEKKTRKKKTGEGKEKIHLEDCHFVSTTLHFGR